jgi:molecular chaperone GrpE
MTLRMADEKKQQSESEVADTAIPIRINHKTKDEPIRVTDRRFWVQPQEALSSDETAFSLKPSYVEELEGKLADSQRKLDEVMASYRVFKTEAAAETQKARERIQNEYNKRLLQAKADIVRKFINIAENLDRALVTSQESNNSAGLLDGVKLIRNQFGAALSELGLEEVKVEGEPFNPEVAEAVETIEVENEDQDNLVLEVVSKGYRINETLVRPAQVKVGTIKSPVSS